VRLDEYSIDDLHGMATADFAASAEAVSSLQALYARLRGEYIALYVASCERSSS